MQGFYRVRLGRNLAYAEECIAGNFIGLDDDDRFGDLTGQLPDDWRSFNRKWVPVIVAHDPGRSKISAGLSCGTVWTVCKGINQGDIVLCPARSGTYQFAEVTGGYVYVPGGAVPHRRPIRWLKAGVSRESMSEALRNSAGALGTVRNLTKFAEELQRLLKGSTGPTMVVSDPTVEDPTAFAMESHLQEFLVKNWSQTELGEGVRYLRRGGREGW